MRRKRPRSSKVLLVLSLTLAIGATLVIRGHLVRLEARAAAAGPGAPTLVAAVDLPRGSTVNPDDVSVRTVPEAFRPPGALASVEEAAGRMLAADVVAGEPLTDARLAAAGGPVAALVPSGLRAVPVAAAIPSGLLAPGDRVDVLATFAGGQPHTETVVSEAEVLSILVPEDGVFDAVANVVLIVSPGVAERLAYARSLAELSISVTSAEPGLDAM